MTRVVCGAEVCLLSTTALVANLAQVARSLTVLISTCERSATIEEGCAASVETLLVPASLCRGLRLRCHRAEVHQRRHRHLRGL